MPKHEPACLTVHPRLKTDRDLPTDGGGFSKETHSGHASGQSIDVFRVQGLETCRKKGMATVTVQPALPAGCHSAFTSGNWGGLTPCRLMQLVSYAVMSIIRDTCSVVCPL